MKRVGEDKKLVLITRTTIAAVSSVTQMCYSSMMEHELVCFQTRRIL